MYIYIFPLKYLYFCANKNVSDFIFSHLFFFLSEPISKLAKLAIKETQYDSEIMNYHFLVVLTISRI